MSDLINTLKVLRIACQSMQPEHMEATITRAIQAVSVRDAALMRLEQRVADLKESIVRERSRERIMMEINALQLDLKTAQIEEG